MPPDDQTTPTTTPTTTPPADTTTTSSSTTPPSPDKTAEPAPKPSLLNDKSGDTPKDGDKKDDKPAGAPETYADFKPPEGYEFDKEALGEASALFKEMNLSQDQAQKLIDVYGKNLTAAIEGPVDFFLAKQEEWVNEIKADPEIGGKLDEVRATTSKAIDTVLGPKLGQSFREAMDYTGAGNHPAFVKAFYKFATLLTEGGHVAGKGPSPGGQQRTGAAQRTAAQALYPDLPSSAGS